MPDLKYSLYQNRIEGQNKSYVTKRATPGERVLGALFPNRGVGFPGGWSQDRLEQVLHMKNWTYVAIHAICKQIAQRLPNLALVTHSEAPRRIEKGYLDEFGNYPYMGIEDYRGIVDKSFQHHDQFHKRKTLAGQRFISTGSYYKKALSVVKPHEELEPLDIEHPLRRLMDNPNPLDTHFDLLYESQMFLELTGVTYMWCVPNGWGVPCEMYVLPSHWVWPRTGGRQYVSPDNPHADELIQYYEVRPWGGMGSAGMIRIPPNEIIMERWKSPINKIDGYSPLAAAAQWIDSEESISKSRWSQFQNQARPEFWVALGEGYEDPSDDTIARIEAKFMQKYQGEFNYGKPIISPPGAKVQPLSFSPTEMAYFQCLDEETECLTDDGWKKYTDLTKETKIACYDKDKGKLVYQTPSNIYTSDYEGEMFHWKGVNIDLHVTPDHRMLVANSWDGDWHVERMKDLQDKVSGYNILVSAEVEAEEPEDVEIPMYKKYSKKEPPIIGSYKIAPVDWARFLGWYVSEGHLAKKQHPARHRIAGASQKRTSKYVPAIEEALNKTPPYEWYRQICGGKDNKGCYQWSATDRGLYLHLQKHCGMKAPDKKLPRYVMKWPAHLLKILLEAACSGDGKCSITDKYGYNSWYYNTASWQLSQDIAEIAIKCGMRVHVIGKEGKGDYKVHMSDRNIRNVHDRNSQMRNKVHYKGKIWCVTVPTSFFLVRRNGCTHITGNSEEQIRDMILSVFNVPGAAVGLVKEMTYGSVLATLAAFCLDDKTECLTSSGWKKYDELTPETRIACYDQDSDSLVYRNPSRIVIKDYSGPMHKWEGECLDAMMTPSHRVFVQSTKSQKGKSRSRAWKIKRIEEMGRTTGYNIRMAARAACDPPIPVLVEKYSGYRSKIIDVSVNIDPELWLKFLGYYVSEGYVFKGNSRSGWKIGITQSKDSDHYDNIEECLNKLPYKWRKDNTGTNCTTWVTNDRGLHEHLSRHCGEGSFSKKVPEYIKSWPAGSLMVFLLAALEGDGSGPFYRNPKYPDVWTGQYGTSSNKLADDIQEIAIKCGCRASIHPHTDKREKYFGTKRYTVTINSNNVRGLAPRNRSMVHYEGKIWCVEVPTGMFVVRRNGCAHITGNCSFCINPRLCMRGLAWTKHLATKFQEHDGDRIRIWWDDCVPHDPQQINADIKLDHDCLAITTNEIRALRGRAPYAGEFGNNPTGTGPGGQVPIPLNTGRDLTELGKLVPVYGKEEPQPQEGAGLEQLMGGEQAAPEAPANASEAAPNQQDSDIAAALGLGGADASTEQKDTTPGVAQANRKPHEPTDTKIQKSMNRIKSYFDKEDQSGLDYFKPKEEKEEFNEEGENQDAKMELIAQILQGVFGPDGIKSRMQPSMNGKVGVS